MKKIRLFLESRKDYGVIFLRLIVGWRLIAGTWPYASQLKPMSEIKEYFIQIHLPVPLICAYLSVYAQFICGILYILGLWLRPAAFIMIINFTVAVIAVHLLDTIEKSFAAWVIMAASLLFLMNGAGKISIDDALKGQAGISGSR